MRILYLHQYFCPPDGWGNTRSLELSRHWVQAGHQVQVLTSGAMFPAPPPQPHVQMDGVQVQVLPVAYSHHMGYTARIRAFIRFYLALIQAGKRMPRPDLIYASSTPLTVAAAGARLARHFGCPWVFETVDVWPDVPIGMGILNNPLLQAVLQGATNRLYRGANLIVSLSEGMAAQVASHGIHQKTILVSHNGTDVLQFTTSPSPAAAPPVRLLYAGTIGPANGVDQLIYALRLLHAEHPHLGWVCDVIGWGKSLPDVQALVPPALQHRILFHPPVPKADLLPWLHRAHVGVVTFAPFPVLEANSANKFFDYLAAGLPVAINYQGWQSQYLHDWHAGLSAPQGDIRAFAQHLHTLITIPATREAMARNARKLAVAKFDRRAIAQVLLERFTRLTPP